MAYVGNTSLSLTPGNKTYFFELCHFQNSESDSEDEKSDSDTFHRRRSCSVELSNSGTFGIFIRSNAIPSANLNSLHRRCRKIFRVSESGTARNKPRNNIGRESKTGELCVGDLVSSNS